MKELLAGLAGLNKPLYFIFLCLSSILLTMAGRSLLISDDLYFEFLGDQLSYDKVTEIIELQKTWEWLSYAILPAYYFTKIFLVAVCIYIGTTIAGIEVSYRKIFQTALFAESIFLLPGVFKLFWFTMVQTGYTLSDIQYFYPLSVLNFFDRNALEIWWIYPLQLMNVFEVLYFLLLAYGLFIVTRTSYTKMLGLVVCTYGTGLFIWTVSVMFLTISFAV